MMMQLLSTILDLLYPRSCIACGMMSDRPYFHFCWQCLSKLRIVTHPFCRICGDPVDGTVNIEYTCSSCNNRRPFFTAARSAARYSGPLENAIQAFKYANMTHLSADFTLFLSACVATHYAGIHFDIVTYVPLYPRKQRERTYNQSQILAESLARKLKLPSKPHILSRIRDTKTQTTLTASQRSQNVRGAFDVKNRDWIEGKTILIVDDVMTTGATVNECARMLKQAKASDVYVVTVARG